MRVLPRNYNYDIDGAIAVSIGNPPDVRRTSMDVQCKRERERENKNKTPYPQGGIPPSVNGLRRIPTELDFAASSHIEIEDDRTLRTCDGQIETVAASITHEGHRFVVWYDFVKEKYCVACPAGMWDLAHVAMAAGIEWLDAAIPAMLDPEEVVAEEVECAQSVGSGTRSCPFCGSTAPDVNLDEVTIVLCSTDGGGCGCHSRWSLWVAQPTVVQRDRGPWTPEERKAQRGTGWRVHGRCPHCTAPAYNNAVAETAIVVCSGKGGCENRAPWSEWLAMYDQCAPMHRTFLGPMPKGAMDAMEEPIPRSTAKEYPPKATWDRLADECKRTGLCPECKAMIVRAKAKAFGVVAYKEWACGSCGFRVPAV